LPLWLGALALGVAYGTGAFHATNRTTSLFALGAGGNHAAVYYRRCADARAASAAPIHAGQPGYRPALDRDHDGIACEAYFRD
jgi:hypothetical protein